MELQEVIDAVNALNDPSAKNQDMVYQVWEDGEITLQKGGDLLWQRTLHCIASGTRPLPVDALVNKYGSHSFIWCTNEVTAKQARALIFDFWH